MPAERLFRAAALEAQRAAPAGRIVLAPPLSLAALTAAAAAIAAAVVAFFFWGTYTAHSTLSGQLVTEPAIVKVYAPQQGVVVERHVEEGQRVGTGDVLYVISSERLSSVRGATREVVAAELEKRMQSLRAEQQSAHVLERNERAALESARAVLCAEVADLTAMLAAQDERAALAEEHAARYAAMHAQGYVSTEQLIARRQDATEQRLRARGFERERRQAERQLGEIEAELESAPVRFRNRKSELERAMAALRQEQVENEAQRSVLVVAPATGIATGVTAHVGQAPDGMRPLVSIVPTDATLLAELHAPSRAIGFVRPGDTVLLRYRAYPYQKFGHHRGTVRSVSRAAFPAAELGAMPAAQLEPLYRIEVLLPAQSLEVNGGREPLQAGMLVDADVLQETRRLYEWVLEPLYSLRR